MMRRISTAETQARGADPGRFSICAFRPRSVDMGPVFSCSVELAEIDEATVRWSESDGIEVERS